MPAQKVGISRPADPLLVQHNLKALNLANMARHLKDRRNMILMAKSGTGKTLCPPPWARSRPAEQAGVFLSSTTP